MENNRNIAAIGLVGMLQEMNNPLTNIQLCIELLESGNIDTEHFYSIMKKSVESMETSIRDICNSFDEENLIISSDNNFPVASGNTGQPFINKPVVK